jgi:hypothetical protein
VAGPSTDQPVLDLMSGHKAAKTIEISEVVKGWPSARSRILAGPPFPKGSGGLF